MSVKVMARVWAHSQRKDGELLVMLALADFANDAGESWPSIPVLAQKARLTDRQARRVLIKLEKAGEIRCVKSNGGRNRRNHYFITLTENPDIITLKELQGNNTSVKKYTGIGDTKTLTPMSGALNRHRTVNKKSEPNGSSLSSVPKSENQRDCGTADDGFEQAMQLYPKRAGSNPKKEACDKWRAQVRKGIKSEELLAGVKRYARYIRATGKEGTELVMQARRFFGPNDEWKHDWTPPSDNKRAAGGFVA